MIKATNRTCRHYRQMIEAINNSSTRDHKCPFCEDTQELFRAQHDELTQLKKIILEIGHFISMTSRAREQALSCRPGV